MLFNNPPKLPFLSWSSFEANSGFFFLHNSLKIHPKTSSYVISKSCVKRIRGLKKEKKSVDLDGTKDYHNTFRNRNNIRGFLWKHPKNGLQRFHDLLTWCHSRREFFYNSILKHLRWSNGQYSAGLPAVSIAQQRLANVFCNGPHHK